MNKPLLIFFDGACEPKNPGGTGSYGFVIFSPDGQELARGSEVIGKGIGMTNNVAEYTGLIVALEWVKANKPVSSVEIHGDSMLVCKMVSGEWGKGNPHAAAPHLRRLLNIVWKTLPEKYSISWIPREQNDLCDQLSKEAILKSGGTLRP